MNPTTVSITEPKYKEKCGGKNLCQASIAAAIKDAREYLAANSYAQYTLTIPPGPYDLTEETAVLPGLKAIFDLSNIRPATGTFTLAGAGSGKTVITTANETTQIAGKNVSNITIEGITFKRKSLEATQGKVLSVNSAADELKLQIPPGFPLVTEMFNPASGNGNWLRAFDNSNPLDPHIDVDPSNVQVHFGHEHPPTCAGRVCTISTDAPDKVPALYTKPNVVVGVKSSKGGEAYGFDNTGVAEGTNVGFKDVVWYDQGRGIWINFKNSFLLDSAIKRRPPINGQTQVMSSSGGGAQFVTPKAMPGTGGGTRIDHFVAESTGDDSIAIFNDMSNDTVVSNTVISSSFARTINLFKSCHVKLENNVGKFCSPQFDFPKQYKGCVTDTSHPGPSPCGPDL